MTIYTPNSFFDDLLKGRINVSSDTFKALLLTESYVFNAAHTRRSNVTAFEHGATSGYTTGGVAITVTSTIDAPNTLLTLGGASFGTGGVKAQFLAVYKSRGGAAADDEILAIQDWERWVQQLTGPLVVASQVIRLRGLI